MPLIKTENIDEHVVAVLWKLEEDLDDMVNAYPFNKEENEELGSIKVTNRQKEWLGARFCLRMLLDYAGMGETEVFKDKLGKPHIKNSDVGISISHTKGYAAAAINLSGAVGIDIEHPRKQILKISKKFLHQDEQAWAENDIQKLTAIWCAKEALYKLHGRTQLTFAEQLLISPIQMTDYAPNHGYIIEKDATDKYTLNFKIEEGLVQCVAY